MGTLDKMFGTDADKETAGIVVQYGEIRVRLARAGGANDRFAVAVEEVTRPYRRMIDAGMLTRDQDKALTREIFARAVVLEWSGVSDAAGVEIPFSPDTAAKVFEDYPEFFNMIVAEAARVANYRAAQLKGEAKN